MTERREAGAFSRTRPPLARTSDMRDDMRDRVDAVTGGGCLGTDSEEREDVDWERTELSGVDTGIGGGSLGTDSDGRETSDTRERVESSGVVGIRRGGGL